MNILLVAPQFGLAEGGAVVPGGLPSFSRSVARALASFPAIGRLGVWAQVDSPNARPALKRMLACHAHHALDLDVRLFGGSRFGLARVLLAANLRREYDRVMYLLVNQAALSLLPGHPPYSVWEIGVELFETLTGSRLRALQRAERLFSISHSTARLAAQHNPALPEACVVHPGLEPPLFEPEPETDPAARSPYMPAERDLAVLIVGNIYRTMPYKGHQQLISAWPQVMAACPSAQLWIVGDGDGRPDLQALARALPARTAGAIHFLGRLSDAALAERYRLCRVLAMPSTGEGFGLVFLEAARHGVPCIGGKHDAAREILVDGETGLLVEQVAEEVASACVRLLTDDALAARLGRAGRERYLSNFCYRHFRARLEQALNLDKPYTDGTD